MKYSLLCGALLFGLAAPAAAQVKTLEPPPAGDPRPPEPTPVIPLAVKPGAPEGRGLRYALLPDPLDCKPGNAAPVWVRAGDAANRNQRKFTDKEDKWRGPAETPLKDFPAAQVRDFLAGYATSLRLADQAARYDRCDWEMPPFTLQDIDMPLEEVQHLRLLASLLSLRYRLELSEGRYDDALRTLQTGFALARDVGNGDLLIQDLVGIAVGSIMFGHVEEWIETPGAPNLFWPLTDLPTPLVNTAHAMRVEMNTIYRSFPPLREVLPDSDRGALSAEDANRIVAELFKDLGTITGENMPEWQQKLGAAALILKDYPDAKKYLKEHGRTDEQVNAMPAAQAVLLYFVEQYDETKDEFLKWMNVAPWEARAGLAEAEKKVRAQGPTSNPINLLLPAIIKCYEARVRIERTADYLRCAEALRLYAMTHDGKPPAKLEDVKLPLPLDPYSGEAFGKFYKVEADGAGVLEIPPPPNMPASLGRRFVLTPPK